MQMGQLKLDELEGYLDIPNAGSGNLKAKNLKFSY